MIVSAVVKQITTRLVQFLEDEITLHWKFKAEVAKMADEMESLAAVMHDADDKVRRGGTDGEQIALWLRRLKSVSFDLEDLLDDLETMNNEAKVRILLYPVARPKNIFLRTDNYSHKL